MKARILAGFARCAICGPAYGRDRARLDDMACLTCLRRPSRAGEVPSVDGFDGFAKSRLVIRSRFSRAFSPCGRSPSPVCSAKPFRLPDGIAEPCTVRRRARLHLPERPLQRTASPKLAADFRQPDLPRSTFRGRRADHRPVRAARAALGRPRRAGAFDRVCAREAPRGRFPRRPHPRGLPASRRRSAPSFRRAGQGPRPG